MDYKNQLLSNLTYNIALFTFEEKKLAEYLKIHHKKVCYMDMDELTKNVQINAETVYTYFKKIGFKDFEEFRQTLRKIITVELSSSDRFEISLEIEPKIQNILHHVVNKEIQNLNNLINSFNEHIFMNIVQEIVNAPEIITVGTRASSSIAIYAEETFNRIGKKSSKIISGGTEYFNFLSTVDRNALVIAFGFARYPKETIKILNFFKKRNFKIISITDDTSSPLAPFSDKILTISCESLSFTDFVATPFAVLNTILIAVSQLDREKSLKHLNEFENVAKDIGFYF